MKNVQIPLTLFLELYGYVVLGEYQFHDDIVRQLEDKHRKVYNHLLIQILTRYQIMTAVWNTAVNFLYRKRGKLNDRQEL